MNEVKWIKITTNIFDDEKIKLIDALPDNDAIIVIWFKLLALAGRSNSGGTLMLSDKVYYTEDMLATIFNRKLSTVKLALDWFAKLKMIEMGDYISIVNWEKYQNVEGLAKIKKQNNERQQLYYYRNKLRELGIDVNRADIPDNAKEIKKYYNKISKNLTLELTLSHATDIDKDKDIEEDIEKEFLLGAHTHPREKTKKNNNATEFIVPNLEDITDFISKNNLKVNPMKFYNYYKAKDWNLKEGLKMSDWKAVVNVWHVNAEEQNNNKATNNNEPEWLDEYIKEFLGE